jgi:hypothetical protein
MRAWLGLLAPKVWPTRFCDLGSGTRPSVFPLALTLLRLTTLGPAGRSMLFTSESPIGEDLGKIRGN